MTSNSKWLEPVQVDGNNFKYLVASDGIVHFISIKNSAKPAKYFSFSPDTGFSDRFDLEFAGSYLNNIFLSQSNNIVSYVSIDKIYSFYQVTFFQLIDGIWSKSENTLEIENASHFLSGEFHNNKFHLIYLDYVDEQFTLKSRIAILDLNSKFIWRDETTVIDKLEKIPVDLKITKGDQLVLQFVSTKINNKIFIRHSQLHYFDNENNLWSKNISVSSNTFSKDTFILTDKNIISVFAKLPYKLIQQQYDIDKDQWLDDQTLISFNEYSNKAILQVNNQNDLFVFIEFSGDFTSDDNFIGYYQIKNGIIVKQRKLMKISNRNLFRDFDIKTDENNNVIFVHSDLNSQANERNQNIPQIFAIPGISLP